jgi:hypothetical protein
MKWMQFGVAVSSGLMLAGAIVASTSPPGEAQGSPQDSVTTQLQQRLSPEQLQAIREAPFSQVFTVGNAYAVKDSDFTGSNKTIGVHSLWADLPNQNKLVVVVKYCLPDLNIAGAGTPLAVLTLSRNGQVLAKIDQVVQASSTVNSEISPATYSAASYQPFYDSYFWSPFGYGYSAPVYYPPVDCSSGGAIFNLMPVRAALAQLPNQTLDFQLLFQNGMTSNWRLGRGTVQALKQLPTIAGE